MEQLLDFLFETHLLQLWYYFASFIIIISVIVFIHEYGHYIVAKWCGVKIEAFSIGFGPEVIGWNDKSGTRWKISYIPMGGYVKMFGDVNPASAPDREALKALTAAEEKVTFHGKNLWQKSAIVSAGPAANFILAIVILTGFIWMNGNAVIEPVVGSVMPKSAAEQAGILEGDHIISVDGKLVEDFNDIQNVISLNTGTAIEVMLERQDQMQVITLTPQVIESKDLFGNAVSKAILGIRSNPERMHFDDVSLPRAFVLSLGRTYEIVHTNLRALGQIVTGDRSIRDMGGPVKIAKYSGQAAQMGLNTTIWLIALLSISLGLINLFPIPVLDGGHLLYYIIEAVQGKPLAEKYQEWGMRAGMAFILLLAVVITFNDVMQLFGY